MISPEYLEAVNSHPALAKLALMARPGTGWTFLPIFVGGFQCIGGFRERRTVTDTIIVRAMDDVTVGRLRNEDCRGPRRSSVSGVLWEYTGTLDDAVDELHALPDPDDPMAPKLLRPTSSTFVINNQR
ncbi:hypothetical protein [Lentzea aerocolonigenes]|uniref:hypothetical protein n=1 Tax=Lentzea aerocolonigenes TaxID=68170 RepID=UPI0004C30388|nr:hypothetical protein [Lentzea aerocolonigenes]MCP2243595.1 hypothetical protein [Lentzea aerocolonigenes]